MNTMFNFGVGKLIATPKYLSDGSFISNPTPVLFSTLTEVSVDIQVEVKQMHAGKRYAIVTRHGKGTIDIKAKHAKIEGGVIDMLGHGSAVGIKAPVFDFATTIPVSPGPYTVTITPPNSGTFVADIGVFNTATGKQMTRVLANPSTGEYTVDDATGVYGFAAADAGKAIKISYEYSAAAGGKVWTLSNEEMGPAPTFTLLLHQKDGGKNFVCKLNSCTSGNLPLSFKDSEFGVHDFQSKAGADDSGEVGYLCMF